MNNNNNLEASLGQFLKNAMAVYPKSGQGFYVNFGQLQAELDDDAVLTTNVLISAGFAQSANTPNEWNTRRGAGGMTNLFSAFPEGGLVDILDALEPV
ncbi:hypothetical protein [Sulfitobacter litoralis]|uniref:hypothetical protein n=1 Tax=Sulfitobacter litoralis TaxID=335975 RepID=UPI002B265ECB|nr:hypothetical protein [Sulfitobacter litoralis]